MNKQLFFCCFTKKIHIVEDVHCPVLYNMSHCALLFVYAFKTSCLCPCKGCPPVWEAVICWPGASVGETVHRACPAIFSFFKNDTGDQSVGSRPRSPDEATQTRKPKADADVVFDLRLGQPELHRQRLVRGVASLPHRLQRGRGQL